MADDTVTAGKSKEEVAYMLMSALIYRASDAPEYPTQADYIKSFKLARNAVYGDSPD